MPSHEEQNGVSLMFEKMKMCWKILTTEPKIEVQKPIVHQSLFSTDIVFKRDSAVILDEAYAKVFQKSPNDFVTPDFKSSMDGAVPGSKLAFQSFNSIVPDALIGWYGQQSFIGYQLCAIISQHWLISKCCLMPAEDAIRNGYKVTVNNGIEIKPEILDDIKNLDTEYKVNKHLENFVNLGRVFGIRIAMFIVDGIDYEKPFNVDGVKPGSYKGITQIDPYWITPELDGDASANPGSPYFYEPTWWRINGNRIHRTHLVIFRTGDLPDILKPSYIYGAVSVPQKIYERVYAAERTANEAPQLAVSKRTTILGCDLTQILANQAAAEERLQTWSQLWNNFGVKLIDREDVAQQFDTSLADLDAVIMTQYQLVAAAANVPATKLLGTTPKGFNATGEYEEASYHEELQSIQNGDLTPFLNRHHLLLIRSVIVPKYGMQPFDTTIFWNPLDAMTAEELATVNKTKADTGNQLIASGAISPQDERDRIINDCESGYNGMEDIEIEESLNPEEIENDKED